MHDGPTTQTFFFFFFSLLIPTVGPFAVLRMGRDEAAFNHTESTCNLVGEQMKPLDDPAEPVSNARVPRFRALCSSSGCSGGPYDGLRSS